jgi:hypothetical protein
LYITTGLLQTKKKFDANKERHKKVGNNLALWQGIKNKSLVFFTLVTVGEHHQPTTLTHVFSLLFNCKKLLVFKFINYIIKSVISLQQKSG